MEARRMDGLWVQFSFVAHIETRKTPSQPLTHTMCKIMLTESIRMSGTASSPQWMMRLWKIEGKRKKRKRTVKNVKFRLDGWRGEPFKTKPRFKVECHRIRTLMPQWPTRTPNSVERY